jgi:hypothetical protein
MRHRGRNGIYFMWIAILQYVTQAEVTVYFTVRVRSSIGADHVIVTTDMAACVTVMLLHLNTVPLYSTCA